MATEGSSGEGAASHSPRTKLSHGTAPSQFFEEGLQQESDDESEQRPLLNKGKGRAVPDVSRQSTDRATTAKDRTKRKPTSIIKVAACFLLLVVVFALLLALAMVQFFTGRMLNRIPLNDENALQEMATKGLVHSDPTGLEFGGMANDTLRMTVKFNAGFQVAKAIDKLYPTQHYQWTWADRVEKRIIAWGVRRAKGVRVSFKDDQAVFVHALLDKREMPLANVIRLAPFEIPLVYSTNNKQDWLREVLIDIAVKVTADEDISKFIKSSWDNKHARLKMVIPEVNIAMPHLSRFAQRFAAQSIKDLTQFVKVDIPDLPFLDDPAKLVNLTSYRIEPIAIVQAFAPGLVIQRQHSPKDQPESSQRIGIFGNATMTNPLVDFRKQFPPEVRRSLGAINNETTEMPWTVPFDALLFPGKPTAGENSTDLSPVSFAKVQMNPFDFAPLQPRIGVSITGVIHGGDRPSPLLDQAMSAFLSRYLACKSTPMLVIPQQSENLPPFINAAISALDKGVQMEIPGAPDPNAQLLTNIRIEDMRFDGAGPNSEILCSGKFVGELHMPEGLEDLNKVLDIRTIWPDVLIFDGRPPQGRADDPILSRSQFPPSPLPRGAFARLKTPSWVKAKTTQMTEYDPALGRNITIAQVSADLHAVPMVVLPGRGDIFRSYIGKIIFHSGTGPDGKVETGTWGLASAKADLQGSGLGLITLHDVNFRGAFFVGLPKIL